MVAGCGGQSFDSTNHCYAYDLAPGKGDGLGHPNDAQNRNDNGDNQHEDVDFDFMARVERRVIENRHRVQR